MLAAHPVFEVATKRTRWYSEHTYDTTAEEFLVRLADLEGCWPHYDRLYRLRPAAAAPFVEIARIAWRTYRLPEAERLLRRVLALDPGDAGARFLLAQALEERVPGEAIAEYERFLALAPRHVPSNSWFIDGWFLENHGYDPGSVEALAALGDLRLRAGDPAAARRCWWRAIGLAPDHHQAPWARVAEGAASGGDFRTAYRFLARAEENFHGTAWDACPYDRPCMYYERLETWARARYAFTYRWKSSGLAAFAHRWSELGALAAGRGEVALALSAFARAARLYRRAWPEASGAERGLRFLAGACRARLRQIDLVALRFSDWWQARSLAEDLVRACETGLRNLRESRRYEGEEARDLRRTFQDAAAAARFALGRAHAALESRWP